MTNERGKPFYDCLRRGGIAVQGVVVLGSFIHVECLSRDTADSAARLLVQAGIKFLKTTHRIDRAKHQNMAKAQCGMTTWVDRYTAHFRV